MKIINYVLKILMLGIFVLFLTFSFNVKGENLEMNSGQPRVIQRMDDELQFPNIVLNEEIDWVNKLGVTFTSPTTWENATWKNILDKIVLKYPYANIYINGNALQKLQANSTPLLPPYFDILSNTNLGNISSLTISMQGYNTTSSILGAKIEYYYSSGTLIGDSGLRYVDYIFTMVISNSYNLGNSHWYVNKPITLYSFDELNPIYNEHIINYDVAGKIVDLEIEFVIYNIPLLNPVMQNVKLTAKCYGTTYINGSISYLDINFENFYYGTDSSNNDQYKFLFNGLCSLGFASNLDGTCSLYIQSKSKLWVEIFVKSTTDINYSETYREEEIGTENCYINSIKLITR